MSPDAAPTPLAAAESNSTAAPSSHLLAAARALCSALVAGLCCLGLWQLAPTSLSISTPIVGTPTFTDFDYSRYFDAFYLIAIAFPLLCILVLAAVSRFGPLRDPRPRGRLFPVSPEGDERLGEDGVSTPWRPLSLALRLALPALVLALEAAAGASVGTSRLTAGAVGLGALYIVAVLLAALVLPAPLAVTRRWWSARRLHTFPSRVALVNSAASLLVVPGALMVSERTSVTVASPPRVVYYPWLPWWLAVAMVAALAAWWWRRARHAAEPGDASHLEGTVLSVVAGSVLVFLAISHLTGALGSFGGFDDAQYLAGAQLTFTHGLLPWRDVYLLHGMIEDVFDGEIGFAVLSHSRWGAEAGQGLIVYPISYCLYYLFAVYFARRRRLIPVIAAIVILAGETTAVMRFAYLPLTVMLLDRVLRERRRGWSIGLGVLLVLEAVLTPEMALMALGILATLIVAELVQRERGSPLLGAMSRSRDALLGALLSGLAWIGYLLATGSLSGFVDYYLVFGSNHALWGAYPLQWSLSGDLRTTTYYVTPVLLELATIWRVIGRVRRRVGLGARDWAMVAAASFVPLYFSKGLDRPDSGHIVEVFTVSMPLVLLWGIQALESGEATWSALRRWTAPRLGSALLVLKSRLSWLGHAEQPVALACALALLVLLPAARSAVQDAPGNLHANSPTEPQLALLGYTNPGAVNIAEITTLGKIIDAYTPAGGPVFDFTNEPGIVYYLLNRVPGTRYFHIEEAETPFAQRQAISELEASRPHLVIFTDYDFGLPTVDGIVGEVRNYEVSQYLLDNYTPLADDNGQLVMIRDDLAPRARPVTTLHLAGVVKGFRGSYFGSFTCAFGYVPNFLQLPPDSAVPVAVPLSGGSAVNTEISGWAVDDLQHSVAKKVVVVSDGKVIAETHPNIYRLDIEDYFATQPGWSAADAARVVDSGFELDFARRPHQPVRIYAINADGTATRILPAPPPSKPLGNGLRAVPRSTAPIIVDGVRHEIAGGPWLSGWVNTLSSTDERVYELRIAPTVELSEFQRLEVTAPGAIGDAAFELADIPGDPSREITFSSLERAGSTLTVPVGSCLQWHGYSGALHLIETGDTARLRTVSLER